jgi:hypothetical protein
MANRTIYVERRRKWNEGCVGCFRETFVLWIIVAVFFWWIHARRANEQPPDADVPAKTSAKR